MTRILVLAILGALVGCTNPVYHHSFITKYDAEGQVIGYEEVESITQQDPSSGGLKIKIKNRDRLEE